MQMPENYLETNKDAWNKRTAVHVDSTFYNVEAFLNGASSLNDTELALLGDISNKKVLHLQCHFGQDSLSLARLGAQVTGVDLSDAAIKKAKELNKTMALNATFICSDIYSLPQHLEEQFDIVFTSYGTVGWLPDLDTWGKIAAKFLKPEGKFVMVDFHPVVWMFDNEFTKFDYSYFNKEVIIDDTTGTYTDRNAAISYREISWNHSLSEILMGLISNGLTVKDFQEYSYSNYNCFAQMEATADNKFIIKPLADKAPLMYSIVATRNK